MKNYPKSRQSDLVVQDYGRETLIYDLLIDKVFCLNETSAMVWLNCDGEKTIEEIAGLMSEKLKANVPPELVWLALDSLKRDNLLEKTETFENIFNGLNRRQIIKKVGFVSMIVLPLISSVIAPSALMAQSGGFALFDRCSSPSQCASNNCVARAVGPICCVAGATPPANTSGIATASCFARQEDCDAVAALNCCSGKGILQPVGTSLCLSPPFNFACFCISG